MSLEQDIQDLKHRLRRLEDESTIRRLMAEMMKKADERLTQAGAHYVIDGIADLPPVIDDINIRLARGERP